MSSMLEQAIVDAAALREAALKNAEQSIIEKYAPQIKEAVKAMLDDTIVETRMYQGRTVEVIHEADEEGNVTVSETGGKPFTVKESDLSEATDDQILQEEEMDAAADTATPPPTEIEAPPAWDSRYGSTESVTLTAMLDNVDADGNIEIDLDAIELSLAQQEEAAVETPPEEPLGGLSATPEETAEETPTDETGGEIDDLLGDLGGGEDMQLQELMDLLSEYDEELLEEEMEVDMGEAKDGWIDTNEGSLEYKKDMEEAKEAHEDEDEGEDEDKKSEDDERLQEALKEVDQFQQTFIILKEQNEKLESVVHKLNDKLEETLLSNAKLLYQNRTLNDAPLNERQKTKIVEAISNAESPKEARSLQETLRATVGSESKKGPQSLSESVNRRSNLSSMLPQRQNINESQTSDPFFAKMKKLAGIK